MPPDVRPGYIGSYGGSVTTGIGLVISVILYNVVQLKVPCFLRSGLVKTLVKIHYTKVSKQNGYEG